jgi:hypothetical protein
MHFRTFLFIEHFRTLEKNNPKKNLRKNPTRKHDKTFMRNSSKKTHFFLQYQRFFYWFDFRGIWFGNLFVWFKEGISINIWVSWIDFLECVRVLMLMFANKKIYANMENEKFINWFSRRNFKPFFFNKFPLFHQFMVITSHAILERISWKRLQFKCILNFVE